MATYKLIARNHTASSVGPIEVMLELAEGARVERCWAGFEGLNPCAHVDGAPHRVMWTIPRLAAGKASAGPFVATASIAAVKTSSMKGKA